MFGQKKKSRWVPKTPDRADSLGKMDVNASDQLGRDDGAPSDGSGAKSLGKKTGTSFADDDIGGYQTSDAAFGATQEAASRETNEGPVPISDKNKKSFREALDREFYARDQRINNLGKFAHPAKNNDTEQTEPLGAMTDRKKPIRKDKP